MAVDIKLSEGVSLSVPGGGADLYSDFSNSVT